MRELFEILDNRRKEKKDSMLVTIVEGSGSIPRTAGAYMAVGEEGYICGTIGGGNLEYQAVLTGKKLIAEKHNYLKEYDLGAGEAAELGMVCGGRAKVLFYYLSAEDNETKGLITGMVQALQQHKPCWLLLPLAEGRARIADKIDTRSHQLILELEGHTYYAENFSGDGKVYIFGGGHLAREVVPVLSHLGFRCVVADDREEFANKKQFPQAEQVEKVDFTRLEDIFTIEENDYIAIMTRGHLCDTDAERFALRTAAGYIGVVGSRKKTKYVREKLMAEGFTEKQLDRIVTPIGLDIGAETPAEIAVSIAGQLIQFRAAKFKD